MAKHPETLMVKVAQGNCGLTRWLIQTPSQYRAFDSECPAERQHRHFDPGLHGSADLALVDVTTARSRLS